MRPQATTDLYRANQERVALLLYLVHQEWVRLGDDLDAGWVRRGPRIVALTAAARVGAARDGFASVPAALEQQGFDVTTRGRVEATRFGATASDGRGLASLLYGGVVVARSAPAHSLPERLQVGRKWLDTVIHTQVVDATRQASQVAITASPGTGYRRYVNPPCCQNCAVLAGKVYRYNAGFDRHPGCDCEHIATSLDGAERDDGYSEEIPDLSQISDLTIAQRKALEDGADLTRVVTKRRDAYRRRMRTPEEPFGSHYKPRVGSLGWIYGQDRGRERTLDLLTRYGYLRPPVALAA